MRKVVFLLLILVIARPVCVSADTSPPLPLDTLSQAVPVAPYLLTVQDDSLSFRAEAQTHTVHVFEEKTYEVLVVNNTGWKWPTDTQISFQGGTLLPSAHSVWVGAVPANHGKRVSITVQAPNSLGTHMAYFALTSRNTRSPNTLMLRARVIAPDFEYGVQTVLPWRYNRVDYAPLARANMEWIKLQVRYPDVPREFVTHAHAHGFRVMFGALGPAEMTDDAGFETDIAAWMGDLAALGVDAIEVWNEPNVDREWAAGHITPRAYTELLCAAWDSIQDVNPATQVIAAAPAPTGAFGGGCAHSGCDDDVWLRGMAAAGSVDCFDFLGAHYNVGAQPPEQNWGHPSDNGAFHHSWYLPKQTRLYFDIFNQRKPIWYTELGYVRGDAGALPGNFSWANETTADEQTQWLLDALRWVRDSHMAAGVIVWNLDAQCNGVCGGAPDPQSAYAILRGAGGCPLCDRSFMP